MGNYTEDQHCPFCGSVVEQGSSFCPTCGASLEDIEPPYDEEPYQEPSSGSFSAIPPETRQHDDYSKKEGYYSRRGPYHSQQTHSSAPSYHQSSSTYRKGSSSSGTLAVIFGALSCAGILPCIGSILAIIFGSSSKDYDDTAKIGFYLGVISCCCQLGSILLVLLILFI
jgi:uncharacterized Zn finger protein (UPF0148 family)